MVIFQWMLGRCCIPILQPTSSRSINHQFDKLSNLCVSSLKLDTWPLILDWWSLILEPSHPWFSRKGKGWCKLWTSCVQAKSSNKYLFINMGGSLWSCFVDNPYPPILHRHSYAVTWKYVDHLWEAKTVCLMVVYFWYSSFQQHETWFSCWKG